MIDEIHQDITDFFGNKRGGVTIFDSLNILKSDRQRLLCIFEKNNAEVLFIESVVADPDLVNENIEIAMKSNKQLNLRKEDAVNYYTKKLLIKETHYERIAPDGNYSFFEIYGFRQTLKYKV